MDDSQASCHTAFLLTAVLPVLSLVVAYGSSVAIEAVGRVGPLDRAVLGWLITMPLVVVAPGLATVPLRIAPRQWEGYAAVGLVAVGLCAFVTWRVAVTTPSLGCQPVRDPFEVLPQALTVGAAFGLTFLAAAIGAHKLSTVVGRGPRFRTMTGLAFGTLFGIAGGLVTLLAAAAAFPGVSYPCG
jgi:hypothetical protein